MNIDNLIMDARSVFTLVSFLTFIGIVLWSYSARRKDAFAEAANLPFADETADASAEERHG